MPNVIPADTVAMAVGEARYLVFDFSGFPELAGSAVLQTNPAPTIRGGSGLTVGTPSVTSTVWDGIPAGKAVTARVSGGTDQLTSKISCVAYAAADVALEVPGVVVVAEVV